MFSCCPLSYVVGGFLFFVLPFRVSQILIQLLVLRILASPNGASCISPLTMISCCLLFGVSQIPIQLLALRILELPSGASCISQLTMIKSCPLS